jgi:hypothetical protein
LTRIIDAYEATRARVCALPGLHSDGDVRASYQDTLANCTPDWNHLYVRGEAAEAALIWPGRELAEPQGLPRGDLASVPAAQRFDQQPSTRGPGRWHRRYRPDVAWRIIR